MIIQSVIFQQEVNGTSPAWIPKYVFKKFTFLLFIRKFNYVTLQRK